MEPEKKWLISEVGDLNVNVFPEKNIVCGRVTLMMGGAHPSSSQFVVRSLRLTQKRSMGTQVFREEVLKG